MGKPFVLITCLFFSMLGAPAATDDGPAPQPDQAIVPLTPELAAQIRKDPYVDESIQTTNGNVVGIFVDVVKGPSGKPVLGVVQAYDNVTRTKQFIAVPWSIFRFDRQHRQIQIQTAADQLRTAPKYNVDQLARLAEGPELQRIHQHFGASMGGGSVAATMGSQSGQGSSTLPQPPTNEAHPTRGSVGAMYILAALVLLVLGFGYFVRRRT
jgi:hypothetical protein